MTRTPRLAASLCFVDDSKDAGPHPNSKQTLWTEEEKKALWASGEVGGFECYVLADDEAAEASDVYKEDPDDDGPLVQSLAVSNTLTVVLQDAGVMRFT
eukprot:CAMPEP_0173448304 /NCGR_PEP_ID=MMETSP1357-20121228/40492_1 /TAXON_ID=77926 /ORGANISM="Hemiselmis rufescens, Strain PCC563" /LENGTH=98 /DNA_ID=CAMNT_0014414803 /DNA_START=54 /DNA_END=347 /DNA_ORIENTATION=-